MSKKLNIAERFELAVPVSNLADDRTIGDHIVDDSFPEPVVKSKVLPCAAGHSNRERGILNHPTHHKANLAALCALYRSINPTGV